MAFSLDFEYEDQKMIFKVANEFFRASGKVALELGWRFMEDSNEDKILPDIKGNV